MPGWPFWAATSDERIDQAFQFAALQGGEHLVDLGCGDGRVLLRAAALHGARVTGVELDAGLAGQARTLLADHGFDGTVVEADFERFDLADADVVFAYLSPATLQRLRPRLASSLRPGARVVTTGYAIPGWEPEQLGGRCYLYRIPVDETDIDRSRRGWDSAGVLTSLRPDTPSLVAVKLHAPGGAVAVHLADGDLATTAAVRTGADVAAPGDEIVVDVRFDPMPQGTRRAGDLELLGGDAPSFPIFAVFDDGEPGVWGLSQSGCDSIAAAFTTAPLDTILAEARASTRP
ncbi:MAG TPA: class I SAM-dependent methyltransferase [Acidimicrobiales bacterium]|nr:class I SAM-dependent methyltransferase [Acidimicrobiales bacterium]